MQVFINDMVTYKLDTHSNISFKHLDLLHIPKGGKHLQDNANAFNSIAKIAKGVRFHNVNESELVKATGK